MAWHIDSSAAHSCGSPFTACLREWACRTCLTMLVLVSANTHAQPPAEERIEELTDIADNPGELRFFVYRPNDSATERLPLVVALHGCTQRAVSFAELTGWLAFADRVPVVLALPEQRSENMARRCFRWYDARDNQAGEGESRSIMSLIDTLVDRQWVDPSQIHIMGLSAGGSMAAVLLANHPERFAGAAIVAGLPVGCNRPRHALDVPWQWLHHSPFAIDGADASYACGIAGFQAVDRHPDEWASYIRERTEHTSDRWPRISLWQGLADDVVDPDNLEESIEQWTQVQGVDADPDDRQRIGSATRWDYHDAEGDQRVQAWAVEGLGHAVPIDPGSPSIACGQTARHAADIELCAVRHMLRFWQLYED